MKNSYLLPIAALALSGIGTLQANMITGNSNGVIGVGQTPSYTLTFNNTPGLATNSAITNQYLFAGVTFSSPAFYDGNSGGFGGCNFANISGDCVTNYTTSGGAITTPPYSPFSILFSTPQVYVAFALATGGATANNTTIAGLRNGVVIEQFTVTTNISTPNDYYGFYNETTPIDQIRITAATGTSSLAMIDNLQVASTPEPGTIGLLATGLGGLIFAARRRRRTV